MKGAPRSRSERADTLLNENSARLREAVGDLPSAPGLYIYMLGR